MYFPQSVRYFLGGKNIIFRGGGEENDLMGKKYTPARPRLAKIK